MVVGDLEFMPVLDAVGRLGELSELYPDAQHEDWEPYRELYPELFAGTEWRVPGTCYLLRSDAATILVDTGVGPPSLWDWNPEEEGILPDALGALGVSQGDIDIVFLMHLHIDHVGWNTDHEGATFFPRARYVVHRDALAFARTQDTRSHVQRCILSLVDRIETIDEEAELSARFRAFPRPGHYPGHMGLRVASGGEEAILIADAAVHPALLAHPDGVYVSDGDSAVCAETRRALLPELVDRDVVVVCGHYPDGGIGRIVRRNETVVWEAL